MGALKNVCLPVCMHMCPFQRVCVCVCAYVCVCVVCGLVWTLLTNMGERRAMQSTRSGSPLVLMSGRVRRWPESRGIFVFFLEDPRSAGERSSYTATQPGSLSPGRSAWGQTNKEPCSLFSSVLWGCGEQQRTSDFVPSQLNLIWLFFFVFPFWYSDMPPLPLLGTRPADKPPSVIDILDRSAVIKGYRKEEGLWSVDGAVFCA